MKNIKKQKHENHKKQNITFKNFYNLALLNIDITKPQLLMAFALVLLDKI